jgi:hypothetical protein
MGYLLTHEVYLQIGMSAENIRPLVERGEGLLCLSMHPSLVITRALIVSVLRLGVLGCGGV